MLSGLEDAATLLLLVLAGAGAIAGVIAGLRSRQFEDTLKAQRERIDLLEEENSRCERRTTRLEGELATLKGGVVADIAGAVATAVVSELRSSRAGWQGGRAKP